MQNQASSLTQSANRPLMAAADATISIAEAANRSGISPTTLRYWARGWPGLASRKGGREWRLDPILLDEMVVACRAGVLHARHRGLEKRQPPAPQVDPARSWLSAREAGAILGVRRRTILRYCENITGLGSRPRVPGAWRVDVAVLAALGAVRDRAGGRLPVGVLNKETQRHFEMLKLTLEALRHPAIVQQMAAIAAERIAAIPPDRKRPRTRPSAVAAGEVRHARS